jgi:hypothetical protein
MQYLHPLLTSYINYPICNTNIKNNYELENQVSITSFTNYPICNTHITGHAESNICWSMLTLSGPLISKCNTNIAVMPKSHDEHDTCNIHVWTTSNLKNHVYIVVNTIVDISTPICKHCIIGQKNQWNIWEVDASIMRRKHYKNAIWNIHM